ncbi:hypothetical protein V8C42DRAFT_337614 [Trichoderma barbatum]
MKSGERDNSGDSDSCLAPPPTTQSKEKTDIEEEKKPSPWNASCPINIRVYSKDPVLKLHTIPSRV